MIEGRPSETALFVALLRAHHYHFAPEPKLLYDSVAQVLSGADSPDALATYVEGITQQFTAMSDRETAEVFVRRITESVCLRSRLVEHSLANAAARGISQMVVLGAGLDSTAYRFAADMPDIAFYEMDYPATQGWKREQLTQAGIEIPDMLTFVPVDFETQTLDEALDAGGVSRDVPTLFSWLGVQPYLTDDAVKATFSVLGRFAAGSELVMDFVQPAYADDNHQNQASVANLETLVAGMREPFKSRFTEAELEARLLGEGFSRVKFYSTLDLVATVLDGRRDIVSMPDQAVYQLSAYI